MENKRKASTNGLDAGGSGAEVDRAAKRRKLQEEFGDLSNGETPESTTGYGLNILDSIRATSDKNGRHIAPYFERLPTKTENPGYYKQIRLPLSLEIIERKLNKHEYPNLSTLEGDFKRLVSNAKEMHPRTSEIFGDAERVRKAVSNLMVKINPAYKAGNYQAVATPLPSSPGPDEEEDAEGEEEDVETQYPPSNDGDADEDGEGEEEEQEEEDEEPEQTTAKRRGGGRSIRNAAQTPKPSRSSSSHGKTDEQVENSFKNLSFQRAQEKIVEDLLRKKDESGDYPYFEAFIYLPPRSLRDYYEIIAEPLSLKALQKQVRGQHGREAATGVSVFKNWAAFEDQASLIWKNAYHYNEDGSDISLMAQELEEQFKELVHEAKQHVPEPPQPKIKLKVPQSSEAAPQPLKKISIYVGGKGSAAASPAPATGHSGEGESTRNGTPVGRNPFGGSNPAAANLSQLDKARSMSLSGASPSPSFGGTVKPEETARQSPTVLPQGSNVTTQQQFVPMMPLIAAQNGVAPPPPPPPPPAPKQTAADILEAQKHRPHPINPSDASLPKLMITSHPSLQMEHKLGITIAASATETQQELVLNAPASYFRLQLRPVVSPSLEKQQREWKLNVLHDFTRLYPLSGPVDKRNEPVFDVNLRYGTNRLEVSLVAALPKGEQGPHGLSMEMEKIIVQFNLLRHH